VRCSDPMNARVARQVGEPVHESAQQQVHLRRVRVAVPRQLEQRPQLGGDVGQRHGLQRSAPAEGLVVGIDSLLDRLTALGQLVEEAGPVEILDRGDPARVGVGA